jgi:CheY-like chemotaxis protein
MASMSASFIDVLLVEDDGDLRDAMADTLEESGYSVAAVANGLECLEWLREAPRPPSLILLDLMMPVMDGWQFRVEQLKDPRLARIPVVILSAMASPAVSDDVEHLKKPVKLQPLLALVARYSGAAAGQAPE